MEHTLAAMDLAKVWFEVALSKEPGKVSKELRLKRKKVLPYFAQLPPATVVMEACGSAHYWAREIERLGHRVVLLPAHHVRPYGVFSPELGPRWVSFSSSVLVRS